MGVNVHIQGQNFNIDLHVLPLSGADLVLGVWMYVYKFLMMPKYKQTRLVQETFKVKQTKIASRLIQGQANKIKKKIRP